MEDSTLQKANNLKAEIKLLERLASVKPDHENNPQFAMNKGSENEALVPISLNKLLFQLFREQLKIKQDLYKAL